MRGHVFYLVVVAMCVLSLVAMYGCSTDALWSDAKADQVQKLTQDEIDTSQAVLDRPESTEDEKAKAAERKAVAQAKLELLAQLREDAHANDATIEAVDGVIGTIGSAEPAFGPLIVGLGGVATAIWQALSRKKAATALSQLSRGLNVGKQNSPDLAKALDSSKAVIGYFLDETSRKIIDETRKAPENNPAVRFA